MVVPTLKGARIDPSTVTGFGRPPVESAEGDLVHVHETTTSALDLVLGRVTIGLLLPAIRALVPCTFAKTEGILSTRGLEPPEREFVDGADLVGIIRATLDGLPDAWQYMCITLHDRIALEAVRALASLITDQPFSHVQPARLTPVQRIHRIARKDALHFLCDTALLSLRRSSIAPSGNQKICCVRLYQKPSVSSLSLSPCEKVRAG
ncbi:hypothetical protein B0F90DRAFT_894505 [Multifurca ochricompacta]|uniref:Uncharacterized protein n=1 Tax=Multifurca ochricompacta TaxID=376703 RepID=A0AAD4M135_9AGAM|nr:hypothetical protein B0F90DRAFT_894505 [Multifurca ochricompacta]